VPGWGLDCHCGPRRPSEPSIELIGAPLCLTIDRSIVGAIRVERADGRHDPVRIRISDSILDATDMRRVALGAPGKLCAHAVLTILRSTVFGELQAHAIELAENSILMGRVRACRRQQGCIRFCYVAPGSHTPRPYECQPDLVERAVRERFARENRPEAERDAVVEGERLRVLPQFNATRFGRPAYAQLAAGTATEIAQGAEDEAEMGAFHDLYQPQRAANLRVRVDEFTPAGIDAGVIFAS
jgi:hypothetical protein